MDLVSCTTEVQPPDKSTVIPVDTPGFDDTNKSDTDILKFIAESLATEPGPSYNMAEIGTEAQSQLNQHLVNKLDEKSHPVFQSVFRFYNVVITTTSKRRTRSDLNEEYSQINSQTCKVTSELGPSPCKIFPKP